jgi:O-antigen/teichoic acid export membrane protein
MVSIKTTLDSFCPPVLRQYKKRIEASPIGYRLAKGAFWSFAGSLISRGLGLLSSILVARILGKADFGHLGMVQSTVGIFGSLAGFGMGLTAIKHVAEFRHTNPERVGRIIGMSSLFSWLMGSAMTVVLFILAPWLAVHTLAAPEMGKLLRAGALLLLLGGVNGAQTGVLSGFEAFKTVAGINLTTGLLSFPFTLVGALNWGVEGAVWAVVVNLIFNCLLNFVAVWKEAARAGIALRYSQCLVEFPLLWRYSLPAVMGGALAGPVTWMVGAILVNQPGGYGQMGVYNAVLRVKMVPDQVLTILLTPLLPVLSETLSRRDTSGYQKAALAAFGLSLLVTAPFALLQVALPMLTLLPYGAGYAGQHTLVQWVMLDLAVIGLFTPFGSIINSMSRMWFAFAYQVCLSLVYWGFGLWLIPKYGGAGFAAANALSRALMAGACLLYMWRFDRMLLCGLPLARMGGVVVLAAAVCFVAGQSGSPWVGIGAFCLALVPFLSFKGLFHSFKAKLLSQSEESALWPER